MNINNDDMLISNCKRKFVYYEKQKQDRLCGIHCLNTLFQGPFFDLTNMTNMAKKLDDLEQSLLSDDMKVKK
jgi:ataxin-3